MHRTLTLAAAVTALAGASLGAAAQDNVLKGKAALGGWQQDKPGVKRLLTVQDLPATSKDVKNFSETAPMPQGAMPQVPPGFAVEMVASGLKTPRVIKTAPNGDLFVAEKETNTVRILRVPSGSAKPAINEVFASGLYQPYGIAFYPPNAEPEWIYIANSDGVVRFRYKSGDLKASGEPELLTRRIPWTHHWTRDIAFTPDGKKMLLSVGSGSNIALDMFPMPLAKGGLEAWKTEQPLGAAWDTEERRAAVLSFDPDGKNEKIFATGLRNCSGLAIHPANGRPWCVVNERDGIGDDTPFEYAAEVKEGAFYGWPWYYIGANEDPRQKGMRPDLKDKVTLPEVYMQAHSAPLQITFYQGDNFPADYKGSAFVTLHGSWNRGQRTGYKVVRLLFDKAGRASGVYEDFMTGFVVDDKKVWGRPVGVTVAQDGSLFVTEDGNGTIWRVTHQRHAAK